MKLKLDYGKRRCLRASRLVKSARLSIHYIASWSSLMLIRGPSRYDLRSMRYQTVATHSLFAVSYRWLVSKINRDQYPLGLVMLSRCFYIKAKAIYTLQLSVSCAISPVE